MMKKSPEARIDYDKFLSEYRSCGSVAKAARAVGVSRRVVYWRAKNDNEFRTKLEAVREELRLPSPLGLTIAPQGPLNALQGPSMLVVSEDESSMEEWQKKFEASLRIYGLVHIAAIQAGLDGSKIEKLVGENKEYAQRVRQLCDEANSRMLFYARERAMSGKADQVLLAWLKAFNENFRDKATLQVSGGLRNEHQHLVLTPEVVRKLAEARATLKDSS